jgi:hypothetical protein
MSPVVEHLGEAGMITSTWTVEGGLGLATPNAVPAVELTRRLGVTARHLVRDLRVERAEDTVVLRGTVKSYHAKQLVQQAVLNELASDPRAILANQLVVG